MKRVAPDAAIRTHRDDARESDAAEHAFRMKLIDAVGRLMQQLQRGGPLTHELVHQFAEVLELMPR